MNRTKSGELTIWMWARVVALGFLIAVPATFIFAGGAGTVARPDATTVVLVETSSAEDLSVIDRCGGEVVVEYGNGNILVEATPSQVQGMSDSGLLVDILPLRTVVELAHSGISFDSREGEPAVPVELRHMGYGADDAGRYLVQFVGPADSWFGPAVGDEGARIEAWLGQNIALVTMDGEAKAAVEGLDIVEWVGIWHPAYKVAMGIPSEGQGMYSALAYDDADALLLAAEVEAIGATINKAEPSIHMLYFACDASLIPTIAAIEGIQLVSPNALSQPLDSKSGEIHKFHHAWYSSWSGLATTLTGTNQRLHIQDSGLDEGNAANGHPDFFDGVAGDRVLAFTDRTGSSSPDGLAGGIAHGTAMTGTAIGNGWCWEAACGTPTNDLEWHMSEAGVAPEAQIVMDGCASGISLATSLTYIDAAFTTYQCYVSSNSWGGASADYSSNSQTIDDMIDGSDGDGANTRMVLFGAGNDGPELHTMSDYAMMKNGLGVGGCENYRPDQRSSDDPNMGIETASHGGPLWSGGRIKPDILASSSSVITTFSRGEWDYNVAQGYGNPQPDFIMEVDEYSYLTLNPGSDSRPDYRYMWGTSTSTPQVAAGYLLTREYLQEVHGVANPTSELCKAFLINGADRMDTDYYDFPGYEQGWGRMNLENSLFPAAPRTNQFWAATATTGGTLTPSGMNLNVVSAEVPLQATLVYVDVPGVALARNLDIRLTSPSGAVYRGNAYVNGWTDPSIIANDAVNNVEQVSIARPEIGVWTLQVFVTALPSSAPFAVVFSADVGPLDTYSPSLSLTTDPIFSVAETGRALQGLTVTNYGTATDTITLDENGPFVMSCTPAGPYTLSSGESVDVAVEYESISMVAGDYPFELTATSAGDGSGDVARVKGQVLVTEVPVLYDVADTDRNERSPSVLTFHDGTNDRIFIAYLQMTTRGVRVMVKHTTLSSATGFPVEPWNGPFEIGAAAPGDYLDPNDVKMVRIAIGTYANRVLVSFNALDAVTYAGTAPETASSTFAAYADLSGAYSSWTTVLIDMNTRTTQEIGVKRMHFTLSRDAAGQLCHVFDHVDYDNGGTVGDPTDDVMSGLGVHMRTSSDGGATWSAAMQVSPADTNYYFYPAGCVDQNGVLWLAFYWRAAAGTERDLSIRLYDGTLGGLAYCTFNTNDNIYYPTLMSTSEGAAGNRVYVGMMRDGGTTDFKVWTTYYDGDVTSATNLGTDSITTDNQDAWGHVRGPFGTAVVDDYIDGPPLVMSSTADGFTYVHYIETVSSYDGVNLNSLRSADGFATTYVVKVTDDGYAKRHQSASSVTSSPSLFCRHKTYEAYYSSYREYEDVDYGIRLAIWDFSWDSVSDDLGPRADPVLALPNPVPFVGMPPAVTVVAGFFDLQLLGVTDAQWKEGSLVSETMTDWTGATAMTLAGSLGSETATASVPTTGWKDGSVHRIFVRGCGSVLSNWGGGSYVDIQVGEPVEWWLQNEDSTETGYKNLSKEPLEGGYIVETAITGPGEFQVGTLEWMTSPFYQATDIAGTWTFNTWANITQSTGNGYLYAKVYRHNGGSPVLLFTTGYDDEMVVSYREKHLFIWKYTAASAIVPESDRLYAEVWLHATAGKADDRSTTTLTYAGTTAAAGPHNAWYCIVDDGTIAEFQTPNSATEATDAQYTSLGTDDTNRWTGATPPVGDEAFMKFEFNAGTVDPATISRIDYKWIGWGSGGDILNLHLRNQVTGAWEATASGSVDTTNNVESTLTYVKEGSVTNYFTTTTPRLMQFGLFNTGTRSTTTNDYAEVKLTTGSDAPRMRLSYDGQDVDSSIVPPFRIYLCDDLIPPMPPTANAGPDQVGAADFLCTFDGSGSYDLVYPIVAYTWTFTYNSLPQTLTGVSPTFNFQIPGVYIVTLTVENSVATTDTDTMTVTVSAASNNPPVSDAGPNQAGKADYLCQFDGSGSTDSDGTITGYSWAFTYNSLPQVLTGVNPTFNFQITGTYTVTLTVTDDDGATDTGTMSVKVTVTDPPVADAGPDQITIMGVPVVFDASNSTDDVGITSYFWVFFYDSGNEVMWGVNPSFTFAIPGVYLVTLSVTDGESDDADTMTVTVLDMLAPEANAGSDQSGIADYLCQFSADFTNDPDGFIASYSWTFTYDGSPQVLAGEYPAFLFQIPGVYTVTLTVSDDDGLTDTDEMTVTVNLLTHNVTFSAGWNLLSFAVGADGGMPLATAFADEWGNIRSIQRYDSLAMKWMVYERSAPSWANSLKTADESSGYWVYFINAGDGQLTITGKALTGTPIQLHSGWNLVGYPSLTSATVETALAGTGYDGIQRYDEGSPYMLMDMLATDTMAPGEGYWVHVPSDVTWTPPA